MSHQKEAGAKRNEGTPEMRGLGRGTRKTQAEWRGSAGALLNISPTPGKRPEKAAPWSHSRRRSQNALSRWLGRLRYVKAGRSGSLGGWTLGEDGSGIPHQRGEHSRRLCSISTIAGGGRSEVWRVGVPGATGPLGWRKPDKAFLVLNASSKSRSLSILIIDIAEI
jgi:hypothetical protein